MAVVFLRDLSSYEQIAWILYLGLWHDQGIWDDTAKWID